MSDKEFIELLNMYVDREISPVDAKRLESEVAANTARREVYDEYCRMQKACSMLSEETFRTPAAHPVASLVSFPAPSAWRMGAVLSGLAAAAAVAVGVYEYHAPGLIATDATAQMVSAAAKADAAPEMPAMKPVFFVKLPEQSGHARILSEPDAASRIAQLSWISDIHISPVPAAPGPGLLLGSKADLKGVVATDPVQASQDQEPLEMTAFRFQR
jgi:hypothetical protein